MDTDTDMKTNKEDREVISKDNDDLIKNPNIVNMVSSVTPRAFAEEVNVEERITQTYAKGSATSVHDGHVRCCTACCISLGNPLFHIYFFSKCAWCSWADHIYNIWILDEIIVVLTDDFSVFLCQITLDISKVESRLALAIAFWFYWCCDSIRRGKHNCIYFLITSINSNTR